MKKIHYISLTLTIIWMIVIFTFSSQTGEASTGTSGRFVSIIIDIFIIKEIIILKLEHLKIKMIRKYIISQCQV